MSKPIEELLQEAHDAEDDTSARFVAAVHSTIRWVLLYSFIALVIVVWFFYTIVWIARYV
jgi:hypothetical protein